MHDEMAPEAQKPQQVMSDINETLERAHVHLEGNNRRMATIRERLYGPPPTGEISENPDKPEAGILSELLDRACDLCNLLDIQAVIITDLERT